MNQRINLLLADLLGWVLTVLQLFGIVGLLIGRIQIANALVAEALLFVLAYVVGVYEHALRKVLQPEQTQALEDATREPSRRKRA